MNEEDIKREKEEEWRKEGEQSHFDCWFDDNYEYLKGEFVEILFDDFLEFCKNEYKDWGQD